MEPFNCEHRAMTAQKIAPCPFCGSECVLVEDDATPGLSVIYYIDCANLCGYSTKIEDLPTVAISAHNRLANSAIALEVAVKALEHFRSVKPPRFARPSDDPIHGDEQAWHDYGENVALDTVGRLAEVYLTEIQSLTGEQTNG